MVKRSMRRWLSRWFLGSAARRPSRFRPVVGPLEDRVVPTTIPVDATHSLQSALCAASSAGGDVIQIESGAAISTLSQPGTLTAPANAGATSVTVNTFISPAEVIDIGSEKGILVDGATSMLTVIVLTLHAPLAQAHAAGEPIHPEAGLLGIGKPVTVQGDPANPPFVFPGGIALELFKAANTSPVVLQNLALSTASGAVITGTATQPGSGTGTAGDLILNNDFLTTSGFQGAAVVPDVGGSLTMNHCQIEVTGPFGIGVDVRTTGNLTITNSFLHLALGRFADSSTVQGNLLVSGCDITLGNSGIGEDSTVGGSMTILNTSVTVNDINGNSSGINLNPLTMVAGNVFISGVTVTVIGPPAGANSSGIAANGGNITVVNSSVRLINEGGAGVGGVGLLATTVNPGVGLVTVSNNVFTSNGLGKGLSLMNPGGMSAVVQGNDFRGNRIGVSVLGDLVTGSAGNIDLGGGALGSLGGNDFRGYPAAGQAASFAIALSGTSSTASISALLNVWGLNASGQTIDPRTVIQDGTNNINNQGTGIINVGVAQLTANEAFVDTVYRTFLGRAANAVTEIPLWANLIPTLGTTGVINAIVREPHHEAYQHLVDGFYEEFLNRPADPTGEQLAVTFLAAGGTVEQVVAGFLNSTEFAARDPFLTLTNNSATGFVQAVYGTLFNRTLVEGNLTPADINAGVSALATESRARLLAAVLGGGTFTTSDGSTFRQAAVRSYYGDPSLLPLPLLPFLPNLLHRLSPPSPPEIAFWDTSGLGVYAIEIAIAGSPENYRDG
jgi:hypothetical protein